jgi:hypothetical protein
MKVILIDPAYKVFNNDKIFDGQMYQDYTMAEPFIRLKKHCIKNSIEISTIDRLEYYLNNDADIKIWSFGNLDSIYKYENNDKIDLSILMLVEPPLISPKIYFNLKKLEKKFHKIFIYNDSFISNIDKFSKFYFFQPAINENELARILESKSRLRRYALIGSNLRPIKSKYQELYSKRIDVMIDLDKFKLLDLYGRGWSSLIGRNYINLRYLFNYFKIQSFYRGPCKSKTDTLNNYEFSIVFENMIMDGYVTEKIFDSMRSGSIPIYLGAPDIEKHVPKNCFVDYRDFKNVYELNDYCMSLSNNQLMTFRNNIFNFFQSEFSLYQDSLINACDGLIDNWNSNT